MRTRLPVALIPGRRLTIGIGSLVIPMLFARIAHATPTYTAIDLHPAGFTESHILATDGVHQVGIGAFPDGIRHALLWNGSAANYVDLHPGVYEYRDSTALGIGGGQQVGYQFDPAPNFRGYISRAILWSGSAAAYVDLTPAGFGESEANAVSGGQQVGTVFTGGFVPIAHAALWTGTPGSFIDLNPAGYFSSEGLAASMGLQGGYAVVVGGNGHAILWAGSAASAKDLNPPGFTGSAITGMDNGREAGVGSGPSTGGADHALLWSGSAESYIDLNPPGFAESGVSSTLGGRQVGSGRSLDNLGRNHAIVWSGTAASYVDLQSFLPSGFIASVATGIDSAGNVVGWATDANEHDHAMMWVPAVPEPTSLSPLSLAAVGLLRRRRGA